MEQQVLNDPLLPPTPEFLKTVLGGNYIHFNHLMEVFDKCGIVPEWKYYKDSKSWLCKARCKKKTVLWLSVWEDCFKLSFFFTDKTGCGIEGLEINAAVKSGFKQQKAVGKLILLLLEVRDNSMLGDAEKVIRYKISCK